MVCDTDGIRDTRSTPTTTTTSTAKDGPTTMTTEKEIEITTSRYFYGGIFINQEAETEFCSLHKIVCDNLPQLEENLRQDHVDHGRLENYVSKYFINKIARDYMCEHFGVCEEEEEKKKNDVNNNNVNNKNITNNIGNDSASTKANVITIACSVVGMLVLAALSCYHNSPKASPSPCLVGKKNYSLNERGTAKNSK